MTMGGAFTQILRSSWVSNLLWTGGGLLALGLGTLYYFQDNLLYHPSIPGMPKSPRENPPGYRSPAEHGIHNFEEHFLKTEDGATIHAWLLLQPDSASIPTVVYFHGNAGNMGFRLPHGSNLYKQCRVNVMMVDYRGYGSSKGTPSEEGLKADGRAVLTALRAHRRVAPDQIVLYGKSLGGAVALALAEERPDEVLAVVLENTFLSIPAMVDVLMPLVKIFKGLILRIGWRNDRRVSQLTHPILFMSGLADELVPPSHMRQLKELAVRSVWAQLYTVADGQHNDTWFRGGIAYYRNFRDFLGKIAELVAEGKAGSKATNAQNVCASTSSVTANVGGEGLQEGIAGGSIPVMPPASLYNVPSTAASVDLNTKKSD